ncbi:uncharacterized protein LOC116268176 [Nymphaea colorata]|nr:uncharacterized protein LOC116268176 [Nymphaea colorata]
MYDTLDGKVLRSFEIMKKVGQGAYGQVWKARNKRTGGVCALKKIYEAFRNASDAQKADLCVALKNSVLKEIHKHYIFYQLANTLSYLHAAELVHRDIKPSNILVNETCEVKLCDFGLIRSLKRDSPNEELVLTENIATRWYRAPEILLCSNCYGKPIDVWSLGCVLAEMVMGRPIFQGSSTLSQLEKIFEVTGKPSAADLDYLKNKSSLNVIETWISNNAGPSGRSQEAALCSGGAQPPLRQQVQGKNRGKMPSAPISILYEVKQLSIEDYKRLIFGEVDEKDIKLSEPASTEELIYKTLPNDLGRNNIIANYPWGNLEKKSPLHSSNMSQKNLSPFAFRQKKEEKEDEASKEKKRERHSPSFLQNRKK